MVEQISAEQRPIRGTVLLDLDGTISDSAAGIFSAYRHAVARVGHPWPDDRRLDWIIGPPLRETLGEWLGDAALTSQALQHYRTYYADGALYENVLYPGISEAIAAIASAGFRLFVATCKLTRFAELIVTKSGLAEYFDGIYGSSPDGRVEHKADVIAACLNQEAIGIGHCIMVGDRKDDVTGAAANGLGCIGVTWGYGGADELRMAKARMICESPDALPAAIELAIG